MSDSSINVVIFITYAILIAVVLDLALILAWRRHNRSRKLQIKAEKKALPPTEAAAGTATKAAAVRTNARSSAGTARPTPVSSGKAKKTDPRAEDQPPADPPPAPARGGAHKKNKAPEKPALAAKPASHVQVTVDLPVGETVRVTIESVGEDGRPVAVQTERLGAKAVSLPVAVPAPVPAGAAAPGGGSFAAALRSILAALARAFGGVLGLARSALAAFWSNTSTAGRSLFYLALILYLASRLIGLTHWPIYFFTDEAVQTNFAAELVKNDLVWHNGEVLPTFFENAGQYEMNFSVYIQVVPYLLFGKSEFVTRGVSVLVTLMGMAAVGLILKKAFRLPQWWSGVLLLSIIPAWFLHSRTAFETAEAVSLYAVFLFFYLLYRTENVKFLFPALFFGALAAYTYSPAQLVVLVTGVLLLLTDIRYHWKHRVAALLGLAFLAVLALPYIRFLWFHANANRDQLAIVSSVWTREIPVIEKFRLYFAEYIKGFDPRYWFLANPPEGVYQDIIRHLMKGYGHIMLWTLPFAAVGLLLCLGNLRSSAFRAILIALLAAPSGAALAQIDITRALFVVVPVSLLTALGVAWLLALFDRQTDGLPDYLLSWRERVRHLLALVAALPRSLADRAGGVRGFFAAWRERARATLASFIGIARIPRMALSLALFLALASVNVYMLWDALTNGPTWYTEYELYGMQYGGEQLSSALVDYQRLHPDANLIVSTSWANGTDEIFSFFLPEDFPYRTGTVDEYSQNKLPLNAQDVFVTTADEYRRAATSDRFSDVTVLQTLPDPDGQPGFYFIRLRYVANIDQIINAEKEELAKPVVEPLALLTGETVQVTHSRLDMGSLTDTFNGEWGLLMRTQTANPMVLDMLFPQSHLFTAVRVRVGGGPTRVSAYFYPPDGGAPKVYSTEVDRSSDFRDLLIQLPTPTACSHLRLEILTVGEGEPNHVHVYGIELDGVGWSTRP